VVFFASRRRHTSFSRDWSSDVCSSDLAGDTFLFANSRADAHAGEREGIARLRAERGNGIKNLSEIWEAQETGRSKEAELLRVIEIGRASCRESERLVVEDGA